MIFFLMCLFIFVDFFNYYIVFSFLILQLNVLMSSIVLRLTLIQDIRTIAYVLMYILILTNKILY